MIEVDVRGYSCPIPVVNTKKALKDNPGKELTVLVESAVSKENVTRLAESEGYSTQLEETGDGYKLVLKPK
ncbi:MAG: sulfurtransferase TusA family protein [Dehalococcoidales bacterium]|nr:MAG: sulfurtransferase TusA family protein [Dehalococcoidales bacterium]